MKPFGLTILGSSSAIPTSQRYPSAHALCVHERLFLIDCGEGTQMQLRRYKIRIQRIGHIFISHLHGDHYLGLAGLLSTMSLLGRTAPLVLYGPAPLKEIIDLQFRYIESEQRFEIDFRPLPHEHGTVLLDDETLHVETLRLNHRIPCCGFLFREKSAGRNIRKEAIRLYDIPTSAIPGIKKGDDFITAAGETIANPDITDSPPRPRSFAYCSDTAYEPDLAERIRHTDLLYHEATFAHDMADRARETYHSTAREAATLARDAGVKQLVIGHFSARYKDLQPLLQEAREVFPHTELAEEGRHFPVETV